MYCLTTGITIVEVAVVGNPILAHGDIANDSSGLDKARERVAWNQSICGHSTAGLNAEIHLN